MIQFVADGIVNGSLIALGAIGLSITYNVLRFANFAQGEILTTGAYFTLAGVIVLGAGAGAMGPIAFGWPLLISLVFAIPAACVVVLAADWLLFRQLRDRNASRITLIMAAFGVSLMGRNLTTLFAGGKPQYYDFYIPKSFEIVAGARVRPDDLAIVAVALVAVALLSVLVYRTSMGRQMRAVAENPTLARINGVDVRAVIRWGWILGTALATVAGVLLAHNTQLRPEMGFDMLLPMFAALILGGTRNLFGTVLGAMVIGITESLVVAVSLSGYRAGVTFLILLAFLLVRPQGLLGESK